MIRVHATKASINGYKVRLLLARLEIDHELVPVDIFGGDTLEAGYADINPGRRTPVLEPEPGKYIPESAAILLYLAEGRDLLPGEIGEISSSPILGQEQIVGARQRLEACGEGFSKSLWRGCRAQALLGDRENDSEGIVHAMGQFAQERSLLLLRQFPVADIDQHVHGSGKIALGVVDRRGIRQDRNAAAVGPLRDFLAASDRLASL